MTTHGTSIDCHRQLPVYLCIVAICLLGARHPLAALLPSLDVPRGHLAFAQAQPLGILYRTFRGWILELHHRLRQYILSQWGPLAIRVGEHWRVEAGRSDHRRTRLDWQFTRRRWLSVGVSQIEGKAERGYRAFPVGVRSHDGFLRSSDSSLSTALSAALPSSPPPQMALVKNKGR